MAKHNLGMVTAYAYAVAGGYTGTEADFEALLGNIATDLEEIENLTVTATTLPEGSSATASYFDGVLTLGIPKGDTGATGAGATATAGTTTTGVPGSDASVVNSGTTKDAVFDFTIPRGDTGNGIESITLTGTVGAVHTYTITFTDGDTTTFEVTDGEVTNDALTAILADYAKTDGAYESMTVGNAEQLISSVYVTDEEPYQFRTSGGSADIGDREFDTLVGGSVAWNQLASNHREETLNRDTQRTMNVQTGGVSSVVNHIYMISCSITADTTSNGLSFEYGVNTTLGKGVGKHSKIIKATASNTIIYVYLASSEATGTALSYEDLCVCDLTQFFSGSTIADYVYNLEQATAGSGIAWLKKYYPKLFTYNTYNAGELISVEATAHNTIGFNQFDGIWEDGTINSSTGAEESGAYNRSKNYIPILPNTVYFGGNGNGTFGLRFYDANKNYVINGSVTNGNATFTTPSNAYFLRLVKSTAINNDICINLSWDGERNGEYEPYVEHSYPLDDSLTLRGIPKIANGKLYYDGDTYESDGTVTRRFVAVDFGSLTWAKSGSTTGGFTGTLSIPYRFANNLEMICSKYVFDGVGASGQGYYGADGTIRYFYYGGGTANYEVYVHDTNYSSASASDFKTAMSGVYLVYELATPTTETADPFTNPQICDDFGTEEYVTTSIVPVGHSTKYTNNLKAKLEMSPESPSGDGDYIVRQTSGTNEYVPLGSTTTISNIIARLEALEGNE